MLQVWKRENNKVIHHASGKKDDFSSHFTFSMHISYEEFKENGYNSKMA